MTQVAFHFGASNRLAYTCRLLRKVAAAGLRVLAVVPEIELDLLDEGLWAVSPTDFVTHVVLEGEGVEAQRSAVLLSAHWPPNSIPGVNVLVNLASECPPRVEWFDRVIEVVSAQGEDRESARKKWRDYRERGYVIQRHDLQQSEMGS